MFAINKTKILILYHSGAGSTEALAEVFHEKLRVYSCDIDFISMNYDYCKLNNYDFFILAFPTYHCEPSRSMKEFIVNMPVLAQRKKAFVFTTCGLYAGNTVRMFIKECSKKNIMVCGSSVYRAPASDGALLLPPFKFMFAYEKSIVSRLREDIAEIINIINKDSSKLLCPAFKLYTLFNYPNKALGKIHKHKISIIKEECINCNKCAEGCIRGCWKEGKKHPEYNVDNCEFCFKCVHHCPKNAVILSSKTMNKPKMNKTFYNELKRKILQEWDS